MVNLQKFNELMKNIELTVVLEQVTQLKIC